MNSTVCACAFCQHRRLRAVVEAEPARRCLGEGLFGARPMGSRSRYREHVAVDLFTGRRAGGHPEHTCTRMPAPSFVERLEAERVVQEVSALVADERILRKQLAAVSDHGDELIASTLVYFYESEDRDVRLAFERAKKAFRKAGRFFAPNRALEITGARK